MPCCRRHWARDCPLGYVKVTRRRKTVLCVIAALMLAVAVIVYLLLKPENLAPAILDYAGKSLGLEITATGVAEYRLRGTPQLVVRNVTAREPGAKTALLHAERMLISLPWSTLRARGNDLTATRLELDAPVLDVAAFQHWQSTRPPSDTPLPTLTRGIGIVRGNVIGSGWKMENLEADLQSLAPGQPVRLHLRGRYASNGLTVPTDAHITLTTPASGASVGVSGQVTIENPDWRIASQARLSARLDTENGIWLQNAVLGTQSRYISGDTSLPFALGVAGPVHFSDSGISLQPVGLAMHGEGAMPTFLAQGGFALQEKMRLELQGALANWPTGWPALPPPVGQSNSPLPFVLAYDGANDFSDTAALQLQRDDTRLDTRFRLFELLDWVNASASGSPLPPITGTLQTPRLEISGAVLEGVELQLEDDETPAEVPVQ